MEKKTPKKPQGWLVLFLVSLVAALALAGTNELTKGAIEQRGLESANAARKAVLNDADSFEQLQVPEGSEVDNGYRGLKGGQTIGYVAQSTVQGYGGPIEVVVGMDPNGTLTGISVGGPNFSETAGLGSKAKESAFTDQFKGLALPAKLRDNVDAISGATITSNAVVLGVNQAGTYMASVAGISVEDKTPSQVKVEGNTVTVTKDGFGGPVDITITIDDGGNITSMTVGGDQFAESPGYGAKAKEPAFTDQFIGKSGKLTLGVDVDAVSGATITSTAVVNGVNDALAALRGESVAPQPTAAPVPTASPQGRTAKATKEGYESPIEAIITLDDAGNIVGITVGENASFDETEGLGAKVKDDAFKAQFIGKTGPFEVGKNIDAVAGATYSSKGVVEAVNAALETLGSEPAKETIGNTETTATEGKTGIVASTNVPDVQPSATTEAAPVPTASPDGRTAKAIKDGFESPIEVIVTLDDAGKIIGITVGQNTSFDETEGLGSKVKEDAFKVQFIGKTGPFEVGKNIDAVTGATFSSKGVVAAVNAALESLSSASEAVPQGRMAKATKDGFESPIEVVVTVDETGKILAITVGENASFGETEGLGTKVKEDAFKAQFIGKTGPFEVGKNIDAVTGATFSSKGVVDAVNAALESLAK